MTVTDAPVIGVSRNPEALGSGCSTLSVHVAHGHQLHVRVIGTGQQLDRGEVQSRDVAKTDDGGAHGHRVATPA